MTLFYCTTNQVRVSSTCVNFCRSYAPFWTYNTGNTQFSALFSYMLWQNDLKFCIWLCFTVLASIFVGVMPLLELRILEIHSFQHFSLTCSSYMHLQIKLKFKIFNAFLFEKYYTKKKPFKMFMTSVLCTVCGAQVYLKIYSVNMGNYMCLI